MRGEGDGEEMGRNGGAGGGEMRLKRAKEIK